MARTRIGESGAVHEIRLARQHTALLARALRDQLLVRAVGEAVGRLGARLERAGASVVRVDAVEAAENADKLSARALDRHARWLAPDLLPLKIGGRERLADRAQFALRLALPNRLECRRINALILKHQLLGEAETWLTLD